MNWLSTHPEVLFSLIIPPETPELIHYFCLKEEVLDMKTKLSFKIIAALISISLAALLFSQGYWLKGLYDSTWIQINGNIEEAMRMADYKEIFIRIDELTQGETHGEE